LIEFLPFLIPISVSALVGIVSLFLYLDTKKTGFLMIGIGFMISALPNLVRLALGGPYLAVRLRERGLTTFEIGQFLFVLELINMSMVIVSALLVLVGLVLFMRNFKTSR